MNGRTRLLIGVALLALGAGTVALGYTGEESAVRYVEDLQDRPQAHQRGTYVLMGVPQPAEIPVTTAAGVVLQDNPEWTDSTSTTVRWSDGTDTWFSTRTVTAAPQTDGTVAWTFRNETRRLPSDPEPAFPPEVLDWTTPAGLRAFTVQAFDDGDGDSPRVWALYGGPVKDPMQPKPSQFTGRLQASLPDGTRLPDGMLVFEVDEYKAGCSSKFLPPEEQARQEGTA